ncbi:MAG: capsular polysaccharide synthesis protein, partial [Woeseiaceae bacterium]
MLPKIIYSYWHQGREAAPPLVRTCMERMEALNPEWQVRILDKDSAEEAVRRIPLSSEKWSRLSLPHRSDLIRTR